MEETIHLHWVFYHGHPVMEMFNHYDPDTGGPHIHLSRGKTIEMEPWIEVARTEPGNKELLWRVRHDKSFIHLLPELQLVAHKHTKDIIIRQMEKEIRSEAELTRFKRWLLEEQSTTLPFTLDCSLDDDFDDDEERLRGRYEIIRRRAIPCNPLALALMDRCSYTQ